MTNHTNVTTPLVTGRSFWDTFVDFIRSGSELLQFLAIVIGAYLIGRIVRWAYMRIQRGRPTSGQLLAGKGIMFVLVFAGIWLAIRYVFDVDPGNMFATLGIVSLALGFGLQNTVANLAAGVSLSLDKPFDVGDRIRVGQTWGDVISIGFRSTSIRTTAGEHVVVPNAILDTQEVWNYTNANNSEMRVEIPLQISYASSFPLAEDLVLRVVRDTKGVLSYPEPRVLIRALGSDGVDLEIRCWISDPIEKARIVDAVLRRVKNRFDESGVHFPFPQRSISYLKDETPPAPTPEYLAEQHTGKPVVLALIRSPLSSATTPAHIVAFAQGADARIVFVHVRPPASTMHPEQGQAALNQCIAAARRAGVSAQARMEVGALAPTVAAVARQEGAKVLALVRNNVHGIARGWMRADQRDIQNASPVPVQLLEPDTPPTSKTMEFWKERLHPDVKVEDAG